MTLTPKQAERAFVPLMALSMSGLISLILTAANIGLRPELLVVWPRQWGLAFAVALPAALLLAPLLRRFLARVTAAPATLRPPSPRGDRTP